MGDADPTGPPTTQTLTFEPRTGTHNLKAHPATTIEVGAERIDVTATEVTGAERDRIWEAQKIEAPQFAEYEASTDRIIPVVMFERR